MANVVKTEYMKRATLGFSEYLAKTVDDLPENPKPGDRCIVASGAVYVCIESGTWDELKISGGEAPSETLNITENGEYDIAEYGTANVNVARGLTGGYTITFKVNDDDYYIASCQQSENITEPPTPTIAGKIFDNWTDEQGNEVTFPYTPSTDTEITANFISAKFIGVANQIFCTLSGREYKAYIDGAICGWGKVGNAYTPIVILQSSGYGYTFYSGNTIYRSCSTEYVYNGVTYYINSMLESAYATDTSGQNYYQFPDCSTKEEAAKAILDAYFAS